PRLIRSQHGQKSRVAQSLHRLGDAWKNSEIFQRERAMRIILQRRRPHQHAVTVEKNGPALHNTTIFRSSELWRQASITRSEARESAAEPFTASPQRMARSIPSHCASQQRSG